MRGNAGPIKSVRLRFTNPRYDRSVRLNTEAIARNMGFDEDRVFDITLAVEEAYANALEHAMNSSLDATLELEIIYNIFSDRLEVTIQDSGCGFKCHPNQFMDKCNLKKTLSSRGLGLELIRTLSDSSEILSSPGLGTLIRITKFLPQNNQAEYIQSAYQDSKQTRKNRKTQ